jgi:hypothetical protein
MQKSKKEYIGTIVEESLEDNRMLNKLNIISVRISGDEDPAARWHLYRVRVFEQEIHDLSKKVKVGWYMHFWDETESGAVVFRNKIYRINFKDKATWSEAVLHGKSVGIPNEQLDFLIEE